MNRLAALALLIVPSLLQAQPTPAERYNEAVKLLRDGTEAEKLRAVLALKDLGPKSVGAIPELTEAFKEGLPARRAEIAKLLASHGLAAKEALPVLLAVLDENALDGQLFLESINAIAALGDPGNREVVRRCMHTENQGRGGRYIVSRAPLYMTQHLAATLPVVTDFLSDSVTHTRFLAAITLASMVAKDAKTKTSPFESLPAATRERTIKALRATIDDSDPNVRSWAAAGLIDTDPTALAIAVPELMAAIQRHNQNCVEGRTLTNSGAEGARLVIEYLDEPNLHNRQVIIACLNQFDDRALPAVIEGLRHPNPRIREGVVRSFGNSNQVDKLWTALAARLHDPDDSVRLAAAITLAGRDPKRASITVPALTALMFDRDSSRRWQALVALRGLGPVARPAVPDLLRRIQSGDRETRVLAAETLAVADGSTWKTYVSVFTALASAQEPGYRLRAVNGLNNAGPNAIAAMPALRKCFDDPDPMVRVQAAEAATRIDPKSIDDAVACLASMFKNPLTDGGARRPYRQWRAAMRVLDKMGPAAKAAVPALLEASRQEKDSGISPTLAALALKLDPDPASEAYTQFRNSLNPGNPDPDEEWLYRIPELKKLAKPLVPDLIAALGSARASQVEAGFDTLTALGPDAKDALPTLREMVKAKKHEARAAALIQMIEKK